MSGSDLPPDDFEELLRRAQESVEDAGEAERARNREERRSEEATASRGWRHLYDILRRAADLNSKEDVAEVLDLILEGALELTGGERAYLLEKEGNGLRSLASRTSEGGDADPDGFHRISHSILDAVLARGETLHVGDALTHPELQGRRSVRDLELRTVVCVPLRAEGRVTGALYVDSRTASRSLRQEERDILENFAEQASAALERARRHHELAAAAETLAEENRTLRSVLAERSRFDNIRGQSPAMRRVYEVLDRVCRNSVTVLIRGETGTGKELVARALHFAGPRREASFVAVNCAAFASSLLESELFGFRKGAFTGADRDREGLVETAHRGTLFLDEIAEMEPDLQSKLLRVIEEREVRRLGENKPRPVDVRIVAATHRDLRQRVTEGKFREDLYFRINVVTLELPPLREREGDVLLLAEHFLEEQRRRLERPDLRLSREALGLLRTHRWPGNVRELRNVIERASALAPDDEIGPEDLGSELGAASPGPVLPRGGSLRETMEAAERAAIEDALRESGGVITRAAERLGVTRQHLHNRLRKFGIDAARHRA